MKQPIEQHDDRRPVVRFGFIELSPRISLADLITIIGLLGAGLTAYWDLRSELRSTREFALETRAQVGGVREQADRDISDVKARQEAARSEIRTELRDISVKLDEIQRYLRDNRGRN